MARTKMVTRTIVTTKCVALCINVQTAEPFNQDFTLAGSYDDEKKLLKELKKYEDDNHKIVHVVDTEHVETLYGLPEDDFIKYATVLPPRNAKF